MSIPSLRPTVTAKEYSNQFHNLRNQFNIEHSKVKSSLKSGTGTDDVYTPSLWCYDKLLFLESYVIPRRNRTSFESEVSLSDVPLSQGTATHIIEENSEHANCYENIEYVEDVFIPELDEMIQARENLCGSSLSKQGFDTNSTSLHRPRRLSPSPSPQRSRSSSLSSVTANNQEEDSFPRPRTLMQSDSSTSGVCTSVRRKKKESSIGRQQRIFYPHKEFNKFNKYTYRRKYASDKLNSGFSRRIFNVHGKLTARLSRRLETIIAQMCIKIDCG